MFGAQRAACAPFGSWRPGGVCASAVIVLAAVAFTPSCGARSGLPVPAPCEAIALELPREIADLDMHVMLDSSGSMADVVGGAATTKWEATTTALQTFLQTPDAAGLGVGMTFFPVVDPAVPDQCGHDSSSCGVPGACKQIGICLESETACQMDVGCTAPGFPDEVCTEVGFCELAPDEVCSDALGIRVGLASARASTSRSARTTTPATSASTPTLPDGQSALVGAMEAREPEGSTTTLPALRGARAQATERAALRPERRQAVVLATDGLPTSCDASLATMSDDLAIQHLADVTEAAAATGVRTFVVGVFTQAEAEQSQDNLDTIAKAGGTEAAFIVSADLDLSEGFARALEQARVVAAAASSPSSRREGCRPRANEHHLGLASLARDAAAARSASQCSAGGVGVYAVEDPDGRRLVLCPSICEAVGASVDATIRVARECAND